MNNNFKFNIGDKVHIKNEIYEIASQSLKDKIDNNKPIEITGREKYLSQQDIYYFRGFSAGEIELEPFYTYARVKDILKMYLKSHPDWKEIKNFKEIICSGIRCEDCLMNPNCKYYCSGTITVTQRQKLITWYEHYIKSLKQEPLNTEPPTNYDTLESVFFSKYDLNDISENPFALWDAIGFLKGIKYLAPSWCPGSLDKILKRLYEMQEYNANRNREWLKEVFR